MPTNKNKEVAAPQDKVPKGWTNSPSLTALKENYDDAASNHSTNMAKINTWNDNLNITGKAKLKKKSGRSNVQPKLIRKHAEWRYAALSEPFLDTTDMFTLKGRTARDKRSAEQNQVLLNYQWNNQIDKVSFVDDMIRSGVDEGTVFIRVGWEVEEQEVTRQVPVYDFYPATDQAQLLELQRAAVLQQQDPYAFLAHVPDEIQEALQLTNAQGQPIYPVLKETTEVTETVFITNQPTAEVCNIGNVRVDPSCNGDITKAQFLTYSFETSKAELRKEPDRYFNINAINADQSSVLAEDDHKFEQNNFQFKDDPRAKVVAHEYWGYWDVDGSGELTSFVCTWVGNVMVRLEENPFPDQAIPFINIQYMPRRRQMYGEPDGELLTENQRIIGAVTRGGIDIMAKSANGQQGMRMDALDSTNEQRFINGENYKFNPAVDPRQAVIDHVYPEMPNSIAMMLNMQNQDAESLTGVKPYSGGLSGDALGDVATAVRGVLDAASKREIGILRRFAKGMSQLAKKIIAMNGAFLADEEIIRVTDEDFVTIRREDLEGNLDIEVVVSTAEQDNVKAQELAFMLQTNAQTMPSELAFIILSDIAKLRKMPNLAKRIENFKPQPDPIAQRKAELEIALLEAEVMDKQAAAQEKMAKAQKALADAGKANSEKDNADLDFVEKQNGLTHQRDVELQGAQAKGNMALEIIKADLANDGKLNDTPTN